MAQTNGNGNGKRQINPRSLENLKLGAEARNRDKIRRNTTLLPETVQWLEEHGNASFMIDTLVASAKSGALKLNSNDAHEQNISSNARDSIIESDAQELRLRLEKVEKLAEDQRLEMERLQASINAHKLEIERLEQLEQDSTEQIIELNQDGFKAATALKEALKAKAVGQIKAQVRFALQLIDDI